MTIVKLFNKISISISVNPRLSLPPLVAVNEVKFNPQLEIIRDFIGQ